MNTNRDIAALVGRILLAAIFILGGWNKIGGFEGTAGYIASKGLPLPQVGAAIAVVVELIGGILLLVGFKARWAALAIFVFLIPTTFIFHAFWAVPPEQMMAQQTQLHEEPRHHGRHADGMGVRSRPDLGRPRRGLTVCATMRPATL